MPLEQGLHLLEVHCLLNVVNQPLLETVENVVGFELREELRFI
jgi:hypothetical protein